MAIDALLSDIECPYSNTFALSQMVLAAVLVGPDLFQTSAFDSDAAYRNMGQFAEQISGRGAVFASGQLLTSVHWFADVGAACGVYSYRENHLAKRAGLASRNWIGWETIEDRLCDAAHF